MFLMTPLCDYNFLRICKQFSQALHKLSLRFEFLSKYSRYFITNQLLQKSLLQKTTANPLPIAYNLFLFIICVVVNFHSNTHTHTQICIHTHFYFLFYLMQTIPIGPVTRKMKILLTYCIPFPHLLTQISVQYIFYCQFIYFYNLKYTYASDS